MYFKFSNTSYILCFIVNSEYAETSLKNSKIEKSSKIDILQICTIITDFYLSAYF